MTIIFIRNIHIYMLTDFILKHIEYTLLNRKVCILENEFSSCYFLTFFRPVFVTRHLLFKYEFINCI